MDAPDLYTEINDDPVPDGLSDAPHPEELYKRWSHQKQEKARLLETIQKLAEENKRIMKERDEFEDECNTLRKRNNVYKKNAKMIFSVCRVELSKRERRIETLERRINSYGIVDGNPYSAAANSNEDDFSSQISLNLDTELKFTGILSELNHELMVLKNRASREDANSNPNPVRDHPFDCRPFRGPKTPPTPSCSKSITARVRASSAERYDRKRDCRNSDVYSGSQSKYRRYDHLEDPKDPYHKMETRNTSDQLGDSNDYYESRDRRHVRRDNDDYINDQSQSERNYGRYRDMGSKETYTNRSDTRIYSRDRDHVHEGERFHDRIDRGFSAERYHDKSRGYDNSQHRHDFKRTGDDNCRIYDHQSSDNQSLREDRDPRYLNGFKRNRASNEDKDEYPDRCDSLRDVVNNRDRYSDRNYYEDNDGRSYVHRSQSSRRFHEDDVTDKGRGGVLENTDCYLSDERHRRRNSRESNSRDRQHTDIRSGHLYPSKRPEKHNMILATEKEIEKPMSHIHERDRKMYRKYEIESGSRGSSQSGVSPISHRHIKEARSSERHHIPHPNGSVDLHIPSSNSSDCSHDARMRDKTIAQSSGNDSDSRKNGRTSCSPIVSPTSTGKGTVHVGGKLVPESHITNPAVTMSAVTKESIEQDNKVPSEQTVADVATFSPSTVSMKTKSDINADPAAWNKMKKVRDRKPILFTKVKESQKPEELDSIQTSLDVSFLRDLNNFTAKEIFQRLGKEGLPRDDFIRAEGVRIQQKEAEENEADNFVLGSEYKQNELSEKPSDSTYTKRMRERLEKEERKISLPKVANPTNAIPSPESPIPEEYVGDNEENGGRTSKDDEKTVNVSAPLPNQETSQGHTVGEEVRSPVCCDNADEDQPKSHDHAHSDILNQLKKLPEEVEGKLDGKEDNGVDICESTVGGAILSEEIPFVESYEHAKVVTGNPMKSERADNKNGKKDDNGDGTTSQEVANESLTADDTEERQSEVCDNSDESHDEDSCDDENPDHSPRKESEPLLDWEYEDDLHLEEVDTADVAADQDQSDGECSTGVQENLGDGEEGEMEEGEILDDSENESVSCTETSKEGKEKQKSKTKKGKKKEKDKSKKVRSQKTKKLKQGTDGHKVRVNKPKVSQKLIASRGGKSQKVKASSRLRYSHDETAFKLTHRLTSNSKVARSSRTESSVRQRHVDKYEPEPQIERLSSLAPRRQRSEIKSATAPRRDDGKVVNGRRKVLSKDVSSDGYRGRSPLCRDNSLSTKSFRSRRHEAIDRHRARR